MVWTEKHLDIVRDLGLNVSRDKAATRLLHSLVDVLDLKLLEKRLKDKPVIVLGCGPSLENDLYKIIQAGLHRRLVLVAADGAVKALLDEDITPHLNVTDLDGDLNATVNANRYGCITVVHAHGDNIPNILKVLPLLKRRVYGTTQHVPTDRVLNFGGFTDGDRACYLAEYFKPKFIALAGMDFGNVVGVYSGHYNKVDKHRKLRIGRELLEELAGKSDIHFFNMTSSGQHINNVHSVDAEKIRELI